MNAQDPDPAAHTGFAPPAPTDAARAARQIEAELGSRYRVGGYLGHGAYATVWRATDRVAGAEVAVKRFEARVKPPKGFYRELSALFRLSHPRTVRIVNVMEAAGGSRYLILEFCPGGSLRAALSRARRAGRRCPAARVREVGRQLVAGLAAAHGLGIAHRDLKPENVLFDAASPGLYGGTAGVKLADFGLARALRPDDPDGGALPSVSGSPAYMAPEQFTGACRAASDLYALGVVLFELLHGHPPFEGAPEELARRHLYEPPAIDAGLPPPWPDLLAGLLAKEPERRPTAPELERRLAEARAGACDARSVAAFPALFGAAGIPPTVLYPPGPARTRTEEP